MLLGNTVADYDEIEKLLRPLIEGVPHATANLANASALIYEMVPDLNWAGFYMMEDGRLVLGPFQGRSAHVEIAVGEGVCGTAVARGETVVVPNVHEFPGHIACDCTSNAEIVVPLRKDGEIIGVLDMDSRTLDRFTEEDREGLERIVKIIVENI